MANEKSEKNETFYKKIFWGAVLFIIVLIVSWGLFGAKIVSLIGEQSYPGTFGDMFGVLNALFAGLAFAGIIYSILLQNADLKLQKEELRLTREEMIAQKEEMRGQKEQMELQNKTLSRQKFENTFFQLLKMFQDTVKDTYWKEGNENVDEGPMAFSRLTKRLNQHLHQKCRENHTPDNDILKILEYGSGFFSSYQNKLGHYFRALYHILKFIKNSDVENKRFYTGLLRAQLSSGELTLLFYNCQTIHGMDKLKPLVEEFSILKHFDAKSVYFAEYIKPLYNRTAFGLPSTDEVIQAIPVI